MTEDVEALINEAYRVRANGNGVEARAAYANAARKAGASAKPLLEAKARRHVSDLDREAGRAAAALDEADAAITLYRAHGGTALDLANAFRLKALALVDLGRPDGAATSWREALDLYRQAGVAEDAGDARLDALIR